MLTRQTSTQKSTIVRFSILVLAGVIAAGCSTLTPRSAQIGPCPPARTLICEEFGPESRCKCSDTTGVDRELARVGLTAQGWAPGW